MSGFNLPRTINPPPRPNLDIILLLGTLTETHPIAHNLARDLGQNYIHLDLRAILTRINSMPDGDHKRSALGLLHPVALRRAIESGGRKLISPRLTVDVLLRRIEAFVEKTGVRKFVITGFAGVDEVELVKRWIAVPRAVVFLEGGVRRGLDVRGWLEREIGGDRVVCVSKGEGKEEDRYGRVLRALGEKALQGGGCGERDEKEEEAARNDLVAMVAKAALRSGDRRTGVAMDAQEGDDDEEMLMEDSPPPTPCPPGKAQRRADSPVAEDTSDVAM